MSRPKDLDQSGIFVSGSTTGSLDENQGSGRGDVFVTNDTSSGAIARVR